jgi:hypothetical protein
LWDFKFSENMTTFTYIIIEITLIVGTRVAQCSVLRLWTGRPGDQGLIPGRGRGFFPLALVSRLALRPTQHPIQWVPGVLSLGVICGLGVMLTTEPI